MKSAGIARATASAVTLAFAVVTTPLAQKAPATGEAVQRAARAYSADAAAQRQGNPVARLRQVEGNVLVSQESGLASAEEALRLDEFSRVITTANAKAVVVYDDGCEVALEPNQRLEIRTDKVCKERVAQAETIFKEPAGIAFAAAGTGVAGGVTAAALSGFAGAGVIGAAGVTGIAALVLSRQDAAVSPN